MATLANSSSLSADRPFGSSVQIRELMRECQAAGALSPDKATLLEAFIQQRSTAGICYDLVHRGLETIGPMAMHEDSGDVANRSHVPLRLGAVVATPADLAPLEPAPVVWFVDQDPVDAIRNAKYSLSRRSVVLVQAGQAVPPVELPPGWTTKLCDALPGTLAPAIEAAHHAIQDALGDWPADVRSKLTGPDEAALSCAASYLCDLLADKRRMLNLRLMAISADLEVAESSRFEGSGGRATTDALRAAIDSKADEVMESAQAELAGWFGTRGKLTQAVLANVRELSDADFEVEESYSRVIRRLSPRVSSEIKIKFQQNAKDLFRAATKASRDAVTKLEEDFFARCRSLGFEKLGYQPMATDEDRAWSAIKGQLDVPVDFKFEQQKRGVLNRLGEGKHLLSAVMMSLTLIGMVAGFQWRKSTEILYLLPVIFIGGIIWSFYSWKQQDVEHVAKELERIREGMSRDLSRTLSESEKAVVAYLRSSINAAAKHLQQFADQYFREAGARQAAETTDRRTRLKEQTRRLETELRTLDQALLRVRSLR